ncbi:DUF4031 domain-containing protein [Pararhodobacter zhoushanensis]|uniref:DUF4031 domain-containing protein n=1 Tax=Pararhodobacter zhoushanensis TaxID=2479545 RepID=UPI000F8C97F0|nr:DUF4031 domain-containing protein [Pararhodobacter zhoushanensis]
MSVYVDPARHPYGRMMMCHMMADSTEELLAMADKIGVARKWIQKAGTRFEHFDIAKSKRTEAIALGAVEVSAMDMARITRWRAGRGPRPSFISDQAKP